MKTSIDDLFAEGDRRLASQGQGTGESGDGLLTTTQKEPQGKEELTGLLNKPQTFQHGGYKPYSIEPGGSPSIKEKIQQWASQTQSEKGTKFGEGPLETAIRQAGFGKELSQLKDMAENLRKEYPKLSDKELAEIVKKAAAGEEKA